MKLTCQKSDLVTALTRARSIGASKTPMPILSTVLLKSVGSGQLQLAATDLEVGYTTSIPAKCDGSELVCVHAGDLLDRVKAMPDGEVKLDATAKAVVVTAKGSKRRFERAAQSGDSFPTLPKMTDGVGFTVSAAMLLTMVEAVHFALNTDTQSATSNMLVRWSPGRLVLAAADNPHLSVEEREVPGIDSTGETLIPIRAVGELRKLLDTDTNVNVVATEAQTFFDFGEFEFTTRRQNATFPPYESFTLNRMDRPMKLPVAAAVDAIGAVGLATGRGDLTANILFSYADGETMFSAESQDRGVARDTVATEWDGGDFSLSINPQYLRDALLAAASSHVALTVDVGNHLAPIRVDPWDAQAGRTHYGIVMPARK